MVYMSFLSLNDSDSGEMKVSVTQLRVSIDSARRNVLDAKTNLHYSSGHASMRQIIHDCQELTRFPRHNRECRASDLMWQVHSW